MVGRGLVQKEDDLGRWFGTVEVGRPGCVFADDVEDARNTLEQIVTSMSLPARVVALSWREIPRLGNELGALVDALAKAALELYPTLYGGARTLRERWSNADLEQEVHDITRALPKVQSAACREIIASCHAGRAPVIRRMANAEVVRQLALAIDPQRLVVLIAALEASGDDPHLRALAQGAEWLATNTEGRVVVLLPSRLAGATELDHLTYGACLFAPKGGEGADGTRVEALPRGGRARIKQQPADLFVSPLAGRPHPRSDAERELHRHLIADSELSPLFAYNQPVRTRFDTVPTVDLLWEDGRVVIEIDGHDHRGERKFAHDRMRDYELLLSGYHVVRFTSSRVLEETATVVELIRSAVRYFGSRETK